MGCVVYINLSSQCRLYFIFTMIHDHTYIYRPCSGVHGLRNDIYALIVIGLGSAEMLRGRLEEGDL